MAMELSRKTWRLGFSSGARNRQVSIDAGNLVALRDAVNQAKSKLGLDGCCPVYSCYEAGRDGFWIHRGLEAMGYSNAVIDSASIEVNRRHRRAKTDRVDLGSLLRLLLRYHGDEPEVMRVVRVPSPEEEDRRHDSGDSRREQGISKAGNRRIRRLMVELCWLWLRYQPDRALSQWYQRRYGHGGPRMRRIGIVAMARKLLIQLWRYLQGGEIPEAAVLKV